MIMGFAVIPLTFATGMSIDYARAARLQTKLNAIADAAALSAVNQPAMENTDETQVKADALAMFNAQASNSGRPERPACRHGHLHPSRRSQFARRRCELRRELDQRLWRRLQDTDDRDRRLFPARATAAPNMDFYLALDTSPSMALPTTTAGIASMDTMMQCSFACHSNKIEQYVTMSMPHLVFDNAFPRSSKALMPRPVAETSRSSR